MKYKITNKIFSPLQISGVGIIPARGSIIVDSVPNSLRIMEKNNKLTIKQYKEK